MNKYLKLAILFLQITTIIFGNENTIIQSDSAYYSSFYPMHVGDKWVYKIDYGSEEYAFYYYYEIVTDTVDSFNRHWFGRRYGDSGDIGYYTITDSFEVVYGFPDSNITNIKYKLNAQPGDKWLIYGDYESGIVFEVDTIYDYGNDIRVMKIDEWNWDNYEKTLWSSSRFLKTGYGLVEIWWEVGPVEYLVGAIIDGVTYGNPNEIEQHQLTIAYDFNLYQNYPNPFNSTTTIKYSVSVNSYVEIIVYDIQGCKVDEIYKGQQNSGEYKILWNAEYLNSGIYFIEMSSIQYSSVKKCLIVK